MKFLFNVNRFLLPVCILIILVVPAIAVKSAGEPVVPFADSKVVQPRQPDDQFIEKYKSQKEFQYTTPPVKAGFLKQLWEYLKSKFKLWDAFVEKLPLLLKLLLIVLAVVILYIIVVKTRIYRFFYSDQKVEVPSFMHIAENAGNINFDEAVKLQVQMQQYRQAVRYMYLKVIGMLREKNLISFSKDKTNFDYLNDLTSSGLSLQFSTLTAIYNHVWYGDVEIAEDQYLKFDKYFQSFYQAIDAQD